ncbi:MFS transporter [Francisella philomiragia]|uniref:Amino acid/peptide transporter family protein n=1 Tax=Francisella philomiragia TaxID=28110 RepID=A0AAW3DBK0_9GAMM|nr:oligopeptide:H+ symporter [Francisella philomiragia]KFJ42557.1 amino acid/peptide transporter family protein [Francisella philomiragia]MBK2253992.1 MFS transporter [Francisella philomiragia]MBK2272304.1 MFS transporter [Francisella philomiragia]MBK2276146.1 MFS transporter [Francisella philomiragia]MBK2280093.1 MFS transporter [Francisella philomiragia]
MIKDIKVRQFSVLWFIELWERYAFYSFQALFMLFITASHISESQGYLIFGIFASLIYITPTIGGYISDKVIGIKNALVTGATLLLLGYVVLAMSNDLKHISWALSLIIVGNGLFKPAPTALISKIFNDNPAQSHSAFTLYYMGVNIGSFLAIAFTPIIAKYTSYSYAFIICVIGMILALSNYAWRARLLKDIEPENKKITNKTKALVSLVCLLQIAICYALFQMTDISLYLIIVVCLLTFLYMLNDAKNTSSKKEKILQIIGVILVIEAVIYFIIYNQMFSTLVLFADHNVNLNLIGFNVSPATYAALDSFWLVVLSPILAILYKKSVSHLSIPYKYSIGTVIAGIAPLTLYLVIMLTQKNGFIDGNWMIIYFFFGALAELLVAALGFSLIAIYFRKEIVTLGMGFFMLALAFGGALSGKLGQLVAMPEGKIDPVMSLNIYQNYFLWLGVITIILGIVYALVARLATSIAKKNNISLG